MMLSSLIAGTMPTPEVVEGLQLPIVEGLAVLVHASSSGHVGDDRALGGAVS